ELSLREISETLGAGSVLEGSVRKAGDDIRITAQLIDAETNEHLWSRDFDRRLAGIFALQTEVALAIVDAMEAELTPEEEAEIQAPPTTNENAYALYLRDRELLGNQPETNRSAIELLKQAVELDPTFTEAWARLAWRYVWESRMGHATAADSAIGLARHALDLDPGSADAHYALASAYDALGSVAEMNASFEDALDADPMHLSTLTDYSSVGAWTGRAAASLRLVVQAVAQVPNDGNIRFHVYLPLLELGDHRLTEAWLDRAGADGMRHARLDMARMWLQVRRQEPEDAAIRALEILERYSGLPEPERTAAQVLAFLGRHEESRPILEQNARRTPDRGAAWGVALVSDRTLYALVLHETGRRADALPLFEASLTSSRAAIEAGEEWSWRPKELASIHALLENHEEALEWLEVAYEAGYRSPALARADPFFASLRGDDRFEALVDRMAAHVSEQHAQADAAGTLAMIDAINAGADPRDYLAAR
ncbi:MAG: hypothetical protein OEN56_16175, partial [Gemmatimonadota bacterium]|nr:hypothetical protein [Gemmatimonadota bacterium]